jgi:hypothetical protein
VHHRSSNLLNCVAFEHSLLDELHRQKVAWSHWALYFRNVEGVVPPWLLEDLRVLCRAQLWAEARCSAASAELVLLQREMLWCRDPLNALITFEDLQRRANEVCVFLWIRNQYLFNIWVMF